MNNKCDCCGCDHDSAQYAMHCEILGHGQYEEFYQKQHNGYMQEFHKQERLKLEKKYRSLYSQTI